MEVKTKNEIALLPSRLNYDWDLPVVIKYETNWKHNWYGYFGARIKIKFFDCQQEPFSLYYLRYSCSNNYISYYVIIFCWTVQTYKHLFLLATHTALTGVIRLV
jgi:hypothetical protein